MGGKKAVNGTCLLIAAYPLLRRSFLMEATEGYPKAM
jgi:hypothetical protein